MIEPLKISVDFYNNNIRSINAKQYDTDRSVIIICVAHGKKIELDLHTVSAFVRYKKPDNFYAINKCEILDDGTVFLKFTQQMLSVSGKCKFDIILVDSVGLEVESLADVTSFEDLGVSVLSTMELYVNVLSSSIEHAEVESSYEYNALVEGLGRLISTEIHMKKLDNKLTENENVRKNNENDRKNNEIARIQNEDDRQDAEFTRYNNENTRIEHENIRQQKEQKRDKAENLRDSAESTRVTQETTRNENEKIRKKNETERQNSHQSMVDSFNGIVVNVPAKQWVRQSGNTYKCTLSVEKVKADVVLDVDFYDDGNATDEQIKVFDEYLCEAFTEDGQVILFANALPTVDFSIILRGKINRYAIEGTKGVKRYGLKINKNDSNPATRCTYLFDAVGMTPAAMNYSTGAFDFGDWGDVFFVKNNYPAMVRYDGTEDYKLDPNDHTKKADGTTASDVANTAYGGNAMSVFDGSGDKGKIWLSQFEIGNYEYMIISNVQYDESYNDDAYVREDGSHADKLYYPMFGGSYDGTRIRSLAGQTLMYNTNASTEITRAKANGNGWNIGSWSKRNLLDCMLKIMSKTDNSQTAFGQGQTSGYVNDASQNYGHLATGTLTNKGQFFGYKDTTHEVKVFYIEKWWGNRWDRINGLLMVGGEILAKMTPPYNLTGKDFEKVGITFASSGSGWQKGTKSSRFGRIVNSTGGSSSTYTCDYFWWNAGITAVALVGGDCSDGDSCGAVSLVLSDSAGFASWYIGASVFLEQPIAA